MLDDHDGRALLDQALEHTEKHGDVARVQADGGLVEDEDGVGLPAAHLARELEALSLAARERGRRLPQREVAQAQVVQGLQLCVRALDVSHMGQRLVNREGKKLGQAEACGAFGAVKAFGAGAALA